MSNMEQSGSSESPSSLVNLKSSGLSPTSDYPAELHFDLGEYGQKHLPARFLVDSEFDEARVEAIEIRPGGFPALYTAARTEKVYWAEVNINDVTRYRAPGLLGGPRWIEKSLKRTGCPPDAAKTCRELYSLVKTPSRLRDVFNLPKTHPALPVPQLSYQGHNDHPQTLDNPNSTIHHPSNLELEAQSLRELGLDATVEDGELVITGDPEDIMDKLPPHIRVSNISEFRNSFS
jgi:hypothetical protein